MQEAAVLPRVDVLIPAFNARTTIVSAIDSIRTQDFDAIRIIVVDDGSSDGTGELLDAMAVEDPRIVVLHQANGGIVAALNAGLKMCSAEYVARHDADDIAYASRFSSQVAYLDANQDCISVGCNAVHIDADGKLTGTRTHFDGDVRPDPHLVPSREPYLLHPFLMARRKVLQAVGGYRYAFHSEDTDLYWRLLGIGRLHNLQAVLGQYRKHAESVSSASVLNGRIAAISSQLAVISYLRREAKEPDLNFPQSALAELQRLQTLEAMVTKAAAAFEADERAYLEAAVAGKLLQLASYRPYQLELDDCHYIRATLQRHDHLITRANREQLHEYFDLCFRRLVSASRLREAFALVSPITIGWLRLRTFKRRLTNRFR